MCTTLVGVCIGWAIGWSIFYMIAEVFLSIVYRAYKAYNFTWYQKNIFISILSIHCLLCTQEHIYINFSFYCVLCIQGIQFKMISEKYIHIDFSSYLLFYCAHKAYNLTKYIHINFSIHCLLCRQGRQLDEVERQWRHWS